MGKSMLAKKVFINTGINITMKMNNGSYSHWKKKHPHTITLPLQISQFS